jgi:hypothetical protein
MSTIAERRKALEAQFSQQKATTSGNYPFSTKIENPIRPPTKKDRPAKKR